MSWDDFRRYGDPSRFALDVALLPDPDGTDRAPIDSVGSWARWRLWINGVNLTQLQIAAPDGTLTAVDGVTWYLAPLLRWLTTNWVALLHETRLPPGAWRVGGRNPRWARGAYLAMVETIGDDADRFGRWHDWAQRHGIRFAADGGILPDVFFQRIADDIELSWGDRIDPGAESVTYIIEDGVARIPVDTFGSVLAAAITGSLALPVIANSGWAEPIVRAWTDMPVAVNRSALAWYLDSTARPGSLTRKVDRAFEQNGLSIVANDNDPWIDGLAPAVAMFGDVSPEISGEAAGLLVVELTAARAARATAAGPARADEIADDEPAWAVSSPWDSGYALALDTLDDTDPAPNAIKTQLERLLIDLGVRVRPVALGEAGPRGVAIAGPDVAPTIVVNTDHISNEGLGTRFTLAHELCHILFDRGRARTLAHSSTPWAPASIEQRANAFAAMLLMPPYRSRIDHGGDLRQQIDRLAATLAVSRSALRHHLANIGEITPYQLAQLSRSGVRGLH